ncbi:hypothetical protein GGR57DRAFT_123097 [Xylariaceae sp. FL1272]|nr:hypothetical protein GGR57DRAFT_123097 [Xylariaceae sp. FL1272]
MQALNRGFEQLFLPLGHHRRKSDLATCALDLTRARPENACASRGTRAYPSPPMSGSPPRPSKPSQEVIERGQGTFQVSGQNVYRTGPAFPGGDYPAAPLQPPLPPPPSTLGRPFPLETQERNPYSYRRAEDPLGRTLSYPPPPGQLSSQNQYSLPPVAGPSLGPSSYPMTMNQPGSNNPHFTSPKTQRKTKGHVASACVPCKRAHLRCDAQRPCSRCLSNGKEDACIDVQHKKRGRPRLRDDREPRFDTGRFGHPPSDPSIRPSLPLYSNQDPANSQFDDPLRRGQPYRALRSQPSDSSAPRFVEHGSVADANVFPPLSIPTQSPEPVALLTIDDLVVVTASSTFIDATMSNSQSVLGYRTQPIVGRKLVDMITPPERDRIVALRQSLLEERKLKEPNYLPPIYLRKEEEKVIRAQLFNAEYVSRYQLDRQEFLTFVAADGQPRPHAVRVGLVKDNSIYFVVLLLSSHSRLFPHPSPSPRSRDVSYSYQSQSFTQLTPISGSFDTGRPRLSDPARESGFTQWQLEASAHFRSTLSPGMSPNVPSYSASTSAAVVGPEHPGGLTHQTPRSEIGPTRPPQQAEYQLPPILGPQQSALPAEPSWQRDDRASRVDIGGLIEKPGPLPRRSP